MLGKEQPSFAQMGPLFSFHPFGKHDSLQSAEFGWASLINYRYTSGPARDIALSSPPAASTGASGREPHCFHGSHATSVGGGSNPWEQGESCATSGGWRGRPGAVPCMSSLLNGRYCDVVMDNLHITS